MYRSSRAHNPQMLMITLMVSANCYPHLISYIFPTFRVFLLNVLYQNIFPTTDWCTMGELKTVVNNWFNTGLVITKHNMEIIKFLNMYDECLDINVKKTSLIWGIFWEMFVFWSLFAQTVYFVDHSYVVW